MNDNDKKRFFEFMVGCAAIYDRELKSEQVHIFFNVLSSYDFLEIEKSFTHHIKTSKFFPTPAEIINNIPKSIANEHIGAEEAWSIAIKSLDEQITVICTNEILSAMDIAKDIYHSGDKVGARMAFREAYNRIILKSDKPSWFVSLGSLKHLREQEIIKALNMGLISHSQAENMLPNTNVAGINKSTLELKFDGKNKITVDS